MSEISMDQLRKDVDYLLIEYSQLLVENIVMRKLIFEGLSPSLTEEQMSNLKSNFYAELEAMLNDALDQVQGVPASEILKKRAQIFEMVGQAKKG